MQAIKRLKRRFIALAMVSLTILLAFIVTGMNIMNYNDVVSDADARLDVLEQTEIKGGDQSLRISATATDLTRSSSLEKAVRADRA